MALDRLPYAKDGPYLTTLDPSQESGFQSWLKKSRAPFDPSPTSDYDMRGFYRDQVLNGTGQTKINNNDGLPHFTDQYKTPYHQSFSNESQYANPTAPRWINDHQLAEQNGNVVFDEQKPEGQRLSDYSPKVDAMKRLLPLPDAGAAPVLPSGPVMNAPLPRLADAATPSISVIPTTRELTRNAIGADRSELNRLQSTGSGIGQLFRPADGSQASAGRRTLGVLGRIGDIAAGVLAPGVERLIPGGEGNHNRLIAQEQQRLGKDLGADQQQAQTELLNAQPALKQAALDNKSLQIENQGQHNEDMAQHYRDQAENTLRGQGYKHDPTGKIIPLDYEELSSQQQGVIDAKKAQADYKSAQAEYEKSKDDPNSFVGQQALAKMQHAKALEGIAYQKIGLQVQNQGLQRERMDFNEDKFYNPQPTGTERKTADLAKSADHYVDVMAEVRAKHPEYFGPAAGRSTEAQAWIGSQDPDAQRYRAAATVAKDHLTAVFGARSKYALEGTGTLFDTKMNNDAFNAQMPDLKQSIAGFNKAGTPHAKGGGANGAGVVRKVVNGKPYDIPQAELADFMREFPNAK